MLLPAALARVRAPGVVVEGNSFLAYVRADFVVMCVPKNVDKIKPTARRAFALCDALYLFTDETDDAEAARAQFAAWRATAKDGALLNSLPVFTRAELPALLARIVALGAACAVS